MVDQYLTKLFAFSIENIMAMLDQKVFKECIHVFLLTELKSFAEHIHGSERAYNLILLIFLNVLQN